MPGANQAWVCTVCGYIHRGAEPPETCPVCGAPRELFEPQAGAPPPPPGPDASRWRCLDCGYIHVGPQPPTKCPDCGAPAERFELLSKTAEVVAEHIEPLSETAGARAIKVVVVGAGIAGVAAVESLRAASPTAEITVISKEIELPYYRLNLTRYLAGEIGEADLPLHPAAWYEERNVRLLLGAEAETIRLDDHLVELHGGEKLPFDKLLLAAGAHPFIPPFPGTDRVGRDQPANHRGRSPHPGGLPRRRPMRLHRRRVARAGNGRRIGPARGRRHSPGRPWLAAAAAVEPTRGRSPPSLCRRRRHQASSQSRHAGTRRQRARSKASCWRTARFFPPT